MNEEQEQGGYVREVSSCTSVQVGKDSPSLPHLVLCARGHISHWQSRQH